MAFEMFNNGAEAGAQLPLRQRRAGVGRPSAVWVSGGGRGWSSDPPPPRSLEIPASPLQPRLAGSPAWRGGPGLPRLGLCGRDRGPLSSQEARPGQRRLSGFSLESAVGAGPRGGRARQMCSRGRLVAVGPAVGRRRRGPCPWWGPNTITPNTGSERTGRAVPMARSLPVPYPHRLSVGKRREP